MHSYRELMNMQEWAFMSGDERLEKRNIELLRRCFTEYGKAQNEDPDIKIYAKEPS